MKDPYEKVYDTLAELNYYQTILKLNNLEDSEQYKHTANFDTPNAMFLDEF